MNRIKHMAQLGFLLSQCLLFQPACGAAEAQQAPGAAPAANGDEVAAIVVSGSKDPDWKTYRAFNAGLDVFDEQRSLAPAAKLRFTLLPKAAHASLKDIKLRIVGQDFGIPVPVAADGTFTVPRNEQASKEDADLMLNRKPGTFRWRADVRTPGLPADVRRLGDLRLECAVRWSIEQYDIPYLMRKLLYAAGQPCQTSRIKVDFIAPRPIIAMYLSTKERHVRLPDDLLEDGGTSYVVPVHDQSWPDDALLKFEYAPPEQAAAR